MKKALVVLAVLALVAWVVSWFWNDEAVATSAARAWPGGMGRLDAAARPLPALRANDASVKLTALVNALPKNDAIGDYVAREIARNDMTIGNAPRLPDVSAIRELLLREPVVWQRDDGIGGGDEMNKRRTVVMTAARVLIANALASQAAAWDDLHAAWNLSRSLDGHPQMMMQTAAFTIARMINAVAWKMPMPPPAWFSELQQRDAVKPLLESFQYQSASYWKDGAKFFPTKWLASNVEHDRLIAEELFKTTQCDVNTRENQLGVDLRFVWRRAFRYRAEREATANALRIREGKPIETKSVCSDGTWSVDGTTLRFSREIAMKPPDTAMPLALKVVTPVATSRERSGR